MHEPVVWNRRALNRAATTCLAGGLWLGRALLLEICGTELLIVASERALPPDGTPYFIAEFVGEDGKEESEHPAYPRSLLRRVLAQGEGRLGLSVKVGFEYELFVFNETPHSARTKGYLNLAPFSPSNFGYSVLAWPPTTTPSAPS